MLIGQEQHFDLLFQTNDDPWGYASVWSEQRRHSLLLAMLDMPVYERVFEPGCANAVFTSLLASRAVEVLAWDGSGEAVRASRSRLRGIANVEVSHRSVPEDWPDGQFDLIVLSDFLYYLSEGDIVEVAEKALDSVSEGGFVLSCHWVQIAHDFLTPGGAAVHEVLQEVLGPVNGPAYLDSDQLITGWRL